MLRAPALALLAALLLGACGGGDVRSERMLAMGTWVDVTLVDADSAQAAAAFADVERMLRAFERDYYAWADGELARLNAALARAETFTASPELAALLRAAQRERAASGGAFDPAVGALVELWGFNADVEGERVPPDAARIEAWLAQRASISNLDIADDGAITAHGAVGKLDLGGIAKGEAVDRIVALLVNAGVANALVNAGGDLRVIGNRGGRPWRVGVQAPRAPTILGTIELASGEAAFTSGDYERFYEYRGQRMHHILDPATGYPVAHTQAVTVLARDGVSADAAATALLVAGPDRWRETAARLGIEAALRVDASGRVEPTAAMRDRLQASAADGSDIISTGP